jgi:hypothetical protein
MAPPQERPYAQTLSKLRKADLLRLSLEFRLAVDGSVVTLRNRIKAYLNAHRDTLYRHPRFKALYPKHTRPIRPRDSSPPPSHVPDNAFQRSPSPSSSDESWNGIEDDQRHHSPHIQVHQPPPPSIPPSEPGSSHEGDQSIGGRKYYL